MPFRKTLRIRLALWNALTVLATAALILIVLRQGVRWAILHEMDQILMEDAEEVALALQELPESGFEQLTGDFERKARGHRHHEWFVQLLDHERRVVWESERTPSSELPVVREDRPSPFQVGNFRVVQRAMRPEMSRVATIRVGVSLTLLNQDLAKIDRLVLALVVLALIMAPLVGYWLASRIAGWIGKIILTASRLRPDCLDERLPVRGTGDELDQLAETVNRLLDRIGESLQQKRDFLANSAHELRTPLAAIRSSVEVALASPRSAEEYEDLLVNIIEQGEALERLVNQLLLISESEVQQLKGQDESVRFDQLVQQAMEIFGAVAESRGLQFRSTIATPVLVRGCRHLLRQLVNNLIDNALKYTPPGGRVDVVLTVAHDSKQAMFSISDNGAGIAPEDVPHVFERFFRVRKSASRSGAPNARPVVADFEAGAEENMKGTGLGLSICQAVAAAHRGVITCDSALGKGTTMTVRLPLGNSHTLGG
jgi:two-component system, OmpR family, heavy metal sensor histidine kinase CusS